MMDAIDQDGVLENASSVGAHILERLGKFAKSCDRIVEVRGLGMIIGVVLRHDARPIVDACLKDRLLVNGTAGNVLRLLPPLNLTREEADSGLDIIERALKTAPTPK
jgi:acetylornithine/succinyldiaminopimelate/putrescine aminotransferase